MNLPELRALAEKATPGHWIHDIECAPGQVYSTHIPNGRQACIAPLICEMHRTLDYRKNADFIAAANPATIVRLLAVVEAAKRLLKNEDDGGHEFIQGLDAIRTALAALEEV